MTTTSLTLALMDACVPGWRAPSRRDRSCSARVSEGAAWQTQLAHGQLRRFQPGTLRGLGCISGALWVTFDGDPADHLLRPGEAMETQGRGAVIVYALEASDLRVQGDR